LSCVSELLEVADGGDERRSRDRSDAFDLSSAPDLLVILVVSSNTLIAPGYVLVKLSPVICRTLDGQACDAGDLVGCVLDYFKETFSQDLGALREHDTELGKKTTDSIDTGGPLFLASLELRVG
jgi:hypothetical protein